MTSSLLSTVWSHLRRPGAVLSMQLLACWPVWIWYARRLADPSDEPLGLVALATVLLAVWRRPGDARVPQTLWAPALGMAAYAAAYPFAPPLVRAGLAATALGATLSAFRLSRASGLSLWGLLLLSLPLLPSLQFYLGYPLRALTAAAAVPLLRLSGFGVVREGTSLAWGDLLVSVDAPCSGVQMLWTGLYLALALAAFSGLANRRTAKLAFLSVGLVLAGNVFRAAALFYGEAGLLDLPRVAHDATGLVVFAATAAAIWGLAHRFPARSPTRTSSQTACVSSSS